MCVCRREMLQIGGSLRSNRIRLRIKEDQTEGERKPKLPSGFRAKISPGHLLVKVQGVVFSSSFYRFGLSQLRISLYPLRVQGSYSPSSAPLLSQLRLSLRFHVKLSKALRDTYLRPKPHSRHQIPESFANRPTFGIVLPRMWSGPELVIFGPFRVLNKADELCTTSLSRVIRSLPLICFVSQPHRFCGSSIARG